MYKIIASGLLILLSIFSIMSQTPIGEANYRIFDSKGNPANLQQIINTASNYDVIFLGENHDDATAHYLQMEIFRQTMGNYAKNRKVALSMEMFERDVQTVLDEYLQNLITEKKFLDDSRPWNNYKTDYRPLVEYAKQNQIPVIAANAPRRYVNIVSRNGREALEKLSPEAKRWIAPLPYNQASPEYAAKFNALMGASPEASGGLNKILDSQTLWDTTMAFSLSEFLNKNKDALVIHLNGAFHTEKRLGTAEQLLKFNPKTKILVVTIRYESDFQSFDKSKHENLGDFVILTDASVPRSFKTGG